MSKKLLRSLTNVVGIDVARFRDRVVVGRRYRTVRPYATYSPWLDDREFSRVFEAISAHTLVDVYRCFELWELAGQVRHIPGAALEVGVWRGGTGALLASRLPEKPVYLCDTFSGVVKATDLDPSYRGGEHSDTSEQIVRGLMQRLGISNAQIERGVFPEETGAKIPELLCFAHIDVDAYLSAKDVFEFVWPRLSVGGVVVFDDYGFETCSGIPPLLAEYRGQPDKLVIHNLNGHAVVIKTA